MGEVKQVGIVGGGVIGSAWAARLLINGMDVALYDPGDGIESRFAEVLENALRAYRRMTLAPTAATGRIRFVDSLEAAVSEADFVQESGPERMDVKQALMKEICRHTGAGVIVASSSSGLLPSAMQAGVDHPERIIVGHPFNPVYLMPLVEIVGGRQTTEKTCNTAAGFYRRIGMHPLIVRKEVEAFLADRMMEALWREALHLLNEGVATADELDQAICYGPGIRWAFMGSFLTFRIAGGEGGMRHFMGQFGPALKWPWTRFDGPDLTEGLLDRIVEQSDEQAAGRSILELERMRDDCIVSILQGLRANHTAAGQVLAGYEEKLYQRSHRSEFSCEDDLSRPLRLHRDIVRPEWVDYNNHMTESRYLHVFGDASDALFRYIGVNEEYHQSGMSYYTVETHMNNLREVEAHQKIEVTTQVLGSDRKRLRIYHEMFRCEDNRLLASAEQMLLHVNTLEGRACPAREEVAERVRILTEAHSRLEQPARAGRSIRL
ncbi:MAG: carnitine 3-dehydrogenase [Gammaproteobacteria bacterium]|nr:carnitine 3-dehydrogenase [Gammaproteobacteria bacterium]